MQTPVTVSFSSSVIINGAGSPQTRFSPFALGGLDVESLENITGIPGDLMPMQLNFRGRGLAAKASAVRNVACMGVTNGAPRRNAAGYVEAAVTRGELVTINFTTPDGASHTFSGIVMSFTPSYGPTGPNQRFDMTFYEVDRVLFKQSQAYHEPAEGS